MPPSPSRGREPPTKPMRTAACRPCVLVTRAQEDCAPMLRAIEEMGAQAIAMPCIAHRRLPPDALAQGVARSLADYHAVAFASRHGAEAFGAVLHAQGVCLPAHLRLFAVGAATAKAVQDTFHRISSQGAHSDAHHLLAAMLPLLGRASCQVVLPAARGGRRVLEEGLRAHGHVPTVLRLYETVLPQATAGRPALWGAVPRFVLFGSPSAVRGFLQLVSFPPQAQAISIGPATSQALAEHGISVAEQASPHDAAGLLNCLRECLKDTVP